MTLFKPARLLALIALLSATPAFAQTQVSDAWVRAAVPGQPASGAFLTLTADTPSRLLDVQSPIAREAQIHEMHMEGDVMRMQRVPSVALPAHQPVAFTPEGYHIMLMGLTGAVKVGGSVPLTLTVEDDKGVRQTLTVQAPVRPLDASGGMHSMH